MEAVTHVFSEASVAPAASLPALQRRLQRALRKVDAEDMLRSCVDRVLLPSTKDDAAGRLMGLIIGPVLCDDAEAGLLAACLEHLCRRVGAADKTVRARSCQWLHGILSSLAEVEVEERICENVVRALVPRIDDRVAAVRVWAVRALGRVVFPEAPAMSHLLRAMESDPVKEIRVAAIESIVLADVSLPAIAARIKDVSPEVRIAALNQLRRKTRITHLRVSLRAAVVQHGLGDRGDGVRAAAAELVLGWLEGVNYDVAKLLSLLGLERYEREAESVAGVLLERAGSSETVSLRRAVWETSPDWSSVSVLSAADVLWAQLRGAYAKNMLASVTSSDLLDQLLPNAKQLSDLLRETHTSSLATQTQQQLMVRYLMRCAALISVDEAADGAALQEVCEEFIFDSDTPDVLMEDILGSWTRVASSNPDSPEATHTLFTRLNSRINASEEHSGRYDLRRMQIITWTLQQELQRPQQNAEQYSEMLPFVLSALAQPIITLRVLAVRCVGLLSLSSESLCEGYRDVLLLVAETDGEDLEVRSQALQAVVDIALVYRLKYKDDSALTALLIRVLETKEEPMLMRQATESVARLLFNESSSSPRLFAQLMKIFFQPHLVPGVLEEEGENLGNETFLGSPARLEQMLSIFFRSYFVAGHGREETALAATAEVIADIASMVKDEAVDETVVQKAVAHVLSLSNLIQSSALNDDKDAAAVKKSFCANISAAISREILNLGDGKSHRPLLKELIKALCSIDPTLWLDGQNAVIMRDLILIIQSNSSGAVDRATEKLLDAYMEFCELSVEFEGSVTMADREAFYARAPGLADFINLLIEERVRPGKRESCRANKAAGGVRMSHKVSAKTKKKRIESDSTEDESENDEDSDETSVTTGGNHAEDSEDEESIRVSVDSLKL